MPSSDNQRWASCYLPYVNVTTPSPRSITVCRPTRTCAPHSLAKAPQRVCVQGMQAGDAVHSIHEVLQRLVLGRYRGEELWKKAERQAAGSCGGCGGFGSRGTAAVLAAGRP